MVPEKPILVHWKYDKNEIAKHSDFRFIVMLENTDDGSTKEFSINPENSGKHIFKIDFPGKEGPYRVGVRAKTETKRSRQDFSGEFYWGFELPAPFEITVNQ